MKLDYIEFPSEYELKYIIWTGLEYDKDKLIEFIQRVNFLKSQKKKKQAQAELKILEEILSEYNSDNLEKLLCNDPQYSRWATIEKLSRRASTDVLLNSKYSRETFELISNLPLGDYKLVMRRSKELIKIVNDAIVEAETDTSQIPGIR